MKKNSYMDSKNILTEMTITQMFKWLFSPQFRKLAKSTKTPKMKKAITDFNNSIQGVEDAYEDAFGKKWPSKKVRI